MEIVPCQDNQVNSVSEFEEIMGCDMVCFSPFAVEALSLPCLFLMVSPFIMLHLHGGNTESASSRYKNKHTPHMNHAITYA